MACNHLVIYNSGQNFSTIGLSVNDEMVDVASCKYHTSVFPSPAKTDMRLACSFEFQLLDLLLHRRIRESTFHQYMRKFQLLALCASALMYRFGYRAFH